MGVNTKKLVAAICDDALSAQDEERLNYRWRGLADCISGSRYLKTHSREGLKEFLMHLLKRSRLVGSSVQIGNRDYLYAQGLVRVFERKGQWIRDYTDWKPRSHNRRKQFSSLLLHLFGQYSVPVFMDTVWFREDSGSYRYRDWYVNLTRGESLRRQKSRVQVTKKIAHYFGTAPGDYSVEEALWWAIVFSLDGNERVATEFNAASPSRLIEEQEFWKGFLRFIIANPLIDRAQIAPIVDFINFQKFDEQQVYEDGEIVAQPPPQPNFSLSRRSPGRLLALVRDWHRQTSGRRHDELIRFAASRIKPYTTRQRRGHPGYSITQLTSNYALYQEGDELGHCIGSYVGSCVHERCTIWSLMRHDTDTRRKLVTIEVTRDNEIVEARGKFNRYPTPGEFEHIERWAAREQLFVSKWVFSD